MKTADFDYTLPPERIAQRPIEPRDHARLLVMDRATGALAHERFDNIGVCLRPGDLLVVNHTRVIPARLPVRKLPGGGKGELLLLNRRDDHTWEALAGGKGLLPGRRFALADGREGEVTEDLGGPRRLVRFDSPLDAALDAIGQTPLPPYIHEPLADPNRYQTVYAQQAGSAAAPTAGLHFTPELLAALQLQGVGLAKVTLHVGLDTFAPVTEDDAAEHVIHSEWCQLTAETAAQINAARAAGGRIIAVGTTSVRTLESAAAGSGVAAFEGPTRLYILPGYEFKVVDALITNFHLPRSTLLMLVSAFADRERILAAYQAAIDEGYRFYSFGDAMFIA
ncbi:MAG: tRNA preQ1(34) S-adenosylmethionine ribosyltransferase-isomerase QueA [Anaerolineae bacterium]|nr:MAG: tRNA preQ1(34) S-adenosylmethionine ribosyltransferase-isomerase QueA [Anaerolineae bacterium]